MKLYTKTGYLNIEGLYQQPFIFNFIIGGRGTGKTYGILKYMLHHKLKFFLVRRQQTQVDIISKPEFNPFRAIDPRVEVTSGSKYHSVFSINGDEIGYCVALSTFSKIRGFDASEVDVIFYDEFIPEAHERPIKNEADALFNAYETTNRNRELQGRNPVKLLCCANSNRVDNPVLLGFNLLKQVEKMYRTETEVYTDPARSILLAVLQKSPISDQKEDTALYRALHTSEFKKMALDNKFSFSADLIRSQDLTNYRIVFRIGDLAFYKSRQGNYTYYVRSSKEDCKKMYKSTDDGCRKMRLDNPFLAIWDAKGYILYENLEVYTRFRELLT